MIGNIPMNVAVKNKNPLTISDIQFGPRIFRWGNEKAQTLSELRNLDMAIPQPQVLILI